MSEVIRFVDVTIRDGQQSLWANNMRTGMILPIAENLDRAGFEAIELTLVHPKKIIRELKEDPWERIREVRKRVQNTPLRQVAGRFRAFAVTPPAMYEMYIERMFANGIRQTRISEEWNQLEGWEFKVAVSKKVGMQPLINLIYALSPRHTDEYYAERARQALSLDPFRIVLKDPGGLLTPERMRTLVPAIRKVIDGKKELELHSHCTTGLGPWNALEAAKLGIRIINVAVPPLANGSSLPSVFNTASNLNALGFETRVDLDVLKPVEEHLTYCARQEGLPIGRPVEYDVSQYHHQIPGGMISNLRHQLMLVGLEHKLEETLEECVRVREEWGWPIMVTPLSQFVGTQAAINVITGARYETVTDQTIHCALGRWGGQEAIEAMDPEIRAKILDRPRAKELADWDPPMPTRKELHEIYGGPGVSEDEMLLRMECTLDEIEAMRSAGARRSYEHLDAEQPLVALIRQLAARTDRNFIQMESNGLVVTMAKSGVA
jgi:oxaloacetate decarboxylase alpha subunit